MTTTEAKTAETRSGEADLNEVKPTGVETRGSRANPFSFRNISAIYIFVAIVIIFSIVTPQTFLQPGVWRTLLDAQSITVIAAIAVLIPLVTGAFNLAIGAEVGFAGIVVATLQVNMGIPFALAIPVTLLAGAIVGLISGLIITKGKIDSFIATLGLSSILLAGLAWLSVSQQITGLQEGFRLVATGKFLGVTNSAYIMVILAFIVWYILERTPVGRRMYAAGYNPEGARLAGVNVARLQIGALMAGGAIAALAGVLLTSRINTGDPTVGPSLLLPALTAVFLGSTQFSGGRLNVWGTLISVYVLATGIKGLQLIGAAPWINDLFNGLALLAAVGLSQWEATSKQTAAIRRILPFGKGRREQPAATTAKDSP